jgi:hypothetical protein
MITYDKVTDIFCLTDEFCKNFEKTTQSFILGKPSKRPPKMAKSEVMCIIMLFHLSGFRCLKYIIFSMYSVICKEISLKRYLITGS